MTGIRPKKNCSNHINPAASRTPNIQADIEAHLFSISIKGRMNRNIIKKANVVNGIKAEVIVCQI